MRLKMRSAATRWARTAESCLAVTLRRSVSGPSSPSQFAEFGGPQDQANLTYILHGVAQDQSDKHFPPHVLADYARGRYHGGELEAGDYDHGHKGMRLDDFLKHEHSKIAKLKPEHVRCKKFESPAFRPSLTS